MESRILENIKILYDYMKINDELEKCDLIMGCGCANLKIPQKCAELYFNGYGKYIVFAGGLGKTTKKLFNKPEAQIYREIATECGVPEDKIVVEDQSTTTPQNFKNTIKILQQEKLEYNSMVIVHSVITTRRTLATAKAYLPNTKIYMTTVKTTFEEFMSRLEKSHLLNETICVLVGNIQRMVIAPQMGYQVEVVVPKQVLKAYEELKQEGYTKYIYTVQEIKQLIEQYGLKAGYIPNYFN